jgi:hypothetical protein
MMGGGWGGGQEILERIVGRGFMKVVQNHERMGKMC